MRKTDLLTREYRRNRYVSGPLVFVTRVTGASFGEIVRSPCGTERSGPAKCWTSRRTMRWCRCTRAPVASIRLARPSDSPVSTARISVSRDMLGRVFSGVGKPRMTGLRSSPGGPRHRGHAESTPPPQ